MDISFKIENEVFNVRTSAFISHNDEVLVCVHKDKDYCSLPGGRVKLNESSSKALVRELKEELNYDIREEELKIVRIVENFFTYNDGRVFHEYLFIYELAIDDSIYNGDFKNLENENITMNWMREEAFILYNVKPGICKGIVADNSLKHIILNEKTND